MQNKSDDQGGIRALETALKQRVKADEAAFSEGSDTLWAHLERAGTLAENIARETGVDPVAGRIAGLFHDAGKFAKGRYHDDDRPEEERSVDALVEMSRDLNLDPELIDTVSESIRQLYRDDPDPTELTKVLFDADNADKMGAAGLVNFFVKAGLRGSGLSPGLLYRLTVELTYSRHAPNRMMTAPGRAIAEKRSPYAMEFIKNLLEQLKEDGLYDFRIEEVDFEGLTIDVVSPFSCDCGGELERKVWGVPGIKCLEIHISHSCTRCDYKNEIKFCNSRLSET